MSRRGLGAGTKSCAKIVVNGSTATGSAPDAPTGLAVTPGDAELTVSWTAPSGTVTGYDVHYTSNTTVAAGAAVQAGAASVGWKAVSRSGTTASQAISSLMNGTTYRVRVRAKNTGDSAWVHSSGTPSASAATAIWSATLTAQRIVSSFRGCDNTGAGAVKCSAAADADRRRLHALEHGLGDNGNTKRWLAHDRLFQPGRADRAGQLQLLRRRDGICVLGRDSRGGQ